MLLAASSRSRGRLANAAWAIFAVVIVVGLIATVATLPATTAAMVQPGGHGEGGGDGGDHDGGHGGAGDGGHGGGHRSGHSGDRERAPGAPDPNLPVALRAVQFTETGLPNGTVWSVALDGLVVTSAGNVLTFNQPSSGIPYRFWVLPVAGGTYIPDPPSGTVTVSGATVTRAISFTLPASNESTVLFTEASLPRNISWTIALNGSNWTSSNGSVQVWLPNGTYNFTVLPVVGFNASPANGTFSVAGRGVLSTIAFAPVAAPRAVIFHQTGLPNGTNWSVVVNATAFWGSGPTIELAAAPGLYGWAVPAAGTNAPSPNNGSFLANTSIGSVTNITIVFGVPSVPLFPITVSETGLPNGTAWSVTVNGATQSGLGAKSFNESNGSYPYSVPDVGSYRPSPANGTVAVSGAPATVSVTFTNHTGPGAPKNYTVTFQATGLKAGANWSVRLGTKSNSSTTDFVNFSQPNGTYTFTATALGYSSAPHTGTVVVNGPSSVAAPVVISFTPSGPGGGGGTAYQVKFVATGLPTGTNWSVVLNGVHQSTTSTTMDFTEANGTLTYTIGPVSGYSANTTGGSVTVRGANSTVFVTFSSPTSSGPSSFLAKIPAWGWAVIGLLVVILIIGVLLVMTRRPPTAPTPYPKS